VEHKVFRFRCKREERMHAALLQVVLTFALAVFLPGRMVSNSYADDKPAAEAGEAQASDANSDKEPANSEGGHDEQSPESDGATESSVSESSDQGTPAPKESPKKTLKKQPPVKRTPVPIAGGDPRGVVDLVVCSQNLQLFGKVGRASSSSSGGSKGGGGAGEEKKGPSPQEQKVRDLVTRFTSAGCDVIAVQEVIARNAQAAREVLEQLAAELHRRTNRFFQVVAAAPSEGQMTNGFLLALDRVSLEQTLPYGRVELPRISKKQRPRLFSRPPLEVQLSVKSRDSEIVKPVSIVNFHFKSKRGGKDDPTGMEWETYRMEMSEALRRITELRHKNAFASGESLLLLLGDRNSNFDVASARILEGSLVLSSFAEKGPCRMSKRGVPLCAAETAMPRKLFSVLTTDASVSALPGTFNYKGEYSWLDDILMPAESLRFAWKTAFSEGEYESGLVQTPQQASDHALVYVKLNW
jgi:hypothetical protein